MFEDWQEKIKTNPQVSKRLLWEYDLDKFDWQGMSKIVVQRVVERGRLNDFYAIFRLYGGMAGVKEIIKNISCFSSPKDITFVCTVFDLKKENLKCYKRKQLREKHLNS